MHTQAESRLINLGKFSTDLGDTYAVCVVTEGECLLKCEMKEIALKKGDASLLEQIVERFNLTEIKILYFV